MAQVRLARVIPSMHVHLCVASWLFSPRLSLFSTSSHRSPSSPSRCSPQCSTRGPGPTPCATSAWGPWSHPTMRHPSHFNRGVAWRTIQTAYEQFTCESQPSVSRADTSHQASGLVQQSNQALTAVDSMPCLIEVHHMLEACVRGKGVFTLPFLLSTYFSTVGHGLVDPEFKLSSVLLSPASRHLDPRCCMDDSLWLKGCPLRHIVSIQTSTHKPTHTQPTHTANKQPTTPRQPPNNHHNHHDHHKSTTVQKDAHRRRVSFR